MIRVVAVIIATLCLVLTPGVVSAHTLKLDGSIGVLTHLEPDDAPVAGQPTKIYIEITDTANQFAPSVCDCTLAVIYEGRAIETLPVTVAGSVTNLSYTFPNSGVYELKITGRPVATAQFRPFTATFDYYVTAGNAGISSAKRTNPLQAYVPYSIFAVGLAVVLLFFWPTNNQSKKEYL
jgi:hypothetical protein